MFIVNSSFMYPYGRSEGAPHFQSPEERHPVHSSYVPDYETLEASFQASGPLLENSENIDALYHTYLGSTVGESEEIHDLDNSHQVETLKNRAKDLRPKKEAKKRTKRRTEEVPGQDESIYRDYTSDNYIHSTPGTYTNNLQGLDLRVPSQMDNLDRKPAVYEPKQEGDAKATSTKIRTTTRRGERGPKSWEFLVRLLAHEKTNPTLIRWEDSEEATFLLVQPTIIAQMWGARSENPNLTYNNFARALRYHYNSGALEAVSERQFMYKCGPRALEYYRLLKEGKDSYGDDHHL